MNDREQWMSAAQQRVHGVRLPRHFYERLATLSGLGTIDWIHSTVEYDGREGLTGRVVAFAPKHLLVFDLDQVSAPQSFTQHLASGTTQVSVLPRAALRSYGVRQVDGHNSAEIWSTDNLAEAESWPRYGARLTVEYDGLDGPLVMPDERNSKGFGAFALALMADLGTQPQGHPDA
jgi:hypothetical protein